MNNTNNSDDTATYTLGNGSGAGFVPGVLNIGVTSLSSGGQTSVITTLGDSDGNLFPGSVDIFFNSNCSVQGLATIESPISATGGVATTTYEAQGCTGSDVITATANVQGSVVTATGSVTVAGSQLGSMQFVSAEPSTIGIKGFGLIESSDVTFKVLDTNGNPVSGQVVNFALNTTVGGVSMTTTSGVSDANGLVLVTVVSGTIHTSVRVTATLVSNSSISSQSDGIAVSTGISDQNSFSLSLSNFNPEAWARDGEQVTANIYAADHFNNPVPDGTAVSFTTEGGQIQPQCLTVAGRCSVVWTSAVPRPVDGRVTILASMLGEESFIDSVPSDGALDNGETFFDLPEAFRDDNEENLYTAFIDEFLDFNSDGQYTAADGLYNGVLCNQGGPCSSDKNIHARGSQVLVMARSNLALDFQGPTTLNGAGESVDGTTLIIYGVHSDGSWQVPPSGTKIEFEATNGVLESSDEVIVPSMNTGAPGTQDGFFDWRIRWRGDDESSSGSLKIVVTVPSGLVSEDFLNLND
ncbi:MAG: Ig-like domain-containing protein [Candidatus Thiodiazotropha sp. (ex Ustalcina ferruginea)]|nr:Ig-like domain-containing protein [Candidatus Thiodiazotropha sp. (ex Ustalcina ferruginea)]